MAFLFTASISAKVRVAQFGKEHGIMAEAVPHLSSAGLSHTYRK
jgi:hypothetical protein